MIQTSAASEPPQWTEGREPGAGEGEGQRRRRTSQAAEVPSQSRVLTRQVSLLSAHDTELSTNGGTCVLGTERSMS